MTHEAGLAEYIVHACPRGPLANQLDAFFAASKAAFGPNTAHGYLPHITATGFFRMEPKHLPRFAAALDGAVQLSAPNRPGPVVQIRESMFELELHCFVIDAPWLTELANQFREALDAPEDRALIRPKDWLHLSLAYGFPPEHHAPLKAMAGDMIDPHAQASWDLCLLERTAPAQWQCHAGWPVGAHRS